MPTLYVGQVAPTSYAMAITPGETGIDLTTVTAANFAVKKSDGSSTVWAAALTGATATTLTATYAFGSLTPLDKSGDWKIYALLTIPSGFIRTETDTLTVKDSFE